MIMRLAYTLLSPIVQVRERMLQALTLGVRVCARDDGGRILLIRHTYIPGWHFPGGGVSPGEAAADAARRELREETGCDHAGPYALLGIYTNFDEFQGNHVALFLTEGVAPAPFQASAEIAAAAWFAPDDLPADAHPSVAARLGERASGAPPSRSWS